MKKVMNAILAAVSLVVLTACQQPTEHSQDKDLFTSGNSKALAAYTDMVTIAGQIQSSVLIDNGVATYGGGTVEGLTVSGTGSG